MPLEQVQRYLTAYLRNPEFRRRVRGGMREQAEREMCLDTADTDLVRKISLDDLDRAAGGLRDERQTKREAEFKQFTDNLACFGPVSNFFEEFDAEYPEGLLSRPLEMDRFLDFSTKFVLNHGLPDYLLDLLRFCYYYVKVSDMPRDRSTAVLEELPPGGLQPHHRLRLRRPYRVVAFRYDVLWLAQSPPSPGLAMTPPNPTELLIQKNWARFKQTVALRTSELPFYRGLADGPASIIDLISMGSPADYSWAVAHLQELFQRGVLEVPLDG